MSANTSEIWNYFSLKNIDDKVAICDICKTSISRGGVSKATTALWKHVKKHSVSAREAAKAHKLTEARQVDDDPAPLYCDVRAGPSCGESALDSANDADSSSCSVSSSQSRSTDGSSAISPSTLQFKQPSEKRKKSLQPSLQQYLDRKQNFKVGDLRREKITDLIVRMICKDCQPLSLVEDQAFKELIHYLEPRYTMVSRKQVANNIIPNLYKKTLNQVKSELKNVDYICATTDFWTSSANDDYMSLTCHYVNNNYELIHRCIEVIQYTEINHTAASIAKFFTEIVSEWEIEDKLVAVIRDNPRTMIAAFNLTRFDHLPCIAHQLQTVIEIAILKSQRMSQVTAICRRLVGHFKHSTNATKALKSCQEKVGAKCHRLIQDEPTRWNSTYLMITRLLEQKPALIVVGGDMHLPAELSNADWTYLMNVHATLKPFYQATMTLSNSRTTAAEVIPMLNVILKYMEEPAAVGSGLQGMRNDIINEMNIRFAKIERNSFYAAATILDPHFKDKIFKNRELAQEAKKLLIQEIGTSSCSEPMELADQSPSKSLTGMWVLYSKFLSNSAVENAFDSPEKEVEAYLQEALLPPDSCTMDFWGSCDRFPNLKLLVRKYLCILPSTVFSERAFSTAGNMVDKKRNRLDPDRVKMLHFLNKNL